MPNQYASLKNLSRLKSLLKFIGLVGTLAINFNFPQPVFAAFLTNWFFDPDNNQLQFTIPPGTVPIYYLENKPARLIVYISDTEVSVDVTELYPAGLVRRVSLSQNQPKQAKVIIDFAPEVLISTRQVKLQQLGSENSWQLRLLVNEGEISQPAESIISDRQPVESAATVEAATEVKNSESTDAPENNQASTSPRQESSGLLETSPTEESPLPNPPPSAEPSVPFLVIPTDKPGNVRSPIIDALGNQDPGTETTQIIEAPKLETEKNEESIVEVPQESSTAESANLPPSIEQESPTLPATKSEQEDTFIPPPPKPNITESIDVITFGEPLPGSSGQKQSKVMEDESSILIAEGEVIGLIYPSGGFILPRDIEQQEVLLLEKAITDESGRIIVPAKTPVVGGFDTTIHGSKFTARAIYVNGRLIPFAAESELLRGHRRINKKNLTASSAGGGLGLLLLTGSGFGFLAGAAIGAGTVVATSPRFVRVETEDIVEVRVIENLPRSRFFQR